MFVLIPRAKLLCVRGVNQAGHKFGGGILGRQYILPLYVRKGMFFFLCLHFVSNNSQNLTVLCISFKLYSVKFLYMYYRYTKNVLLKC
jgi:hypothetical protein